MPLKETENRIICLICPFVPACFGVHPPGRGMIGAVGIEPGSEIARPPHALRVD